MFKVKDLMNYLVLRASIIILSWFIVSTYFDSRLDFLKVDNMFSEISSLQNGDFGNFIENDNRYIDQSYDQVSTWKNIQDAGVFSVLVDNQQDVNVLQNREKVMRKIFFSYKKIVFEKIKLFINTEFIKNFDSKLYDVALDSGLKGFPYEDFTKKINELLYSCVFYDSEIKELEKNILDMNIGNDSSDISLQKNALRFLILSTVDRLLSQKEQRVIGDNYFSEALKYQEFAVSYVVKELESNLDILSSELNDKFSKEYFDEIFDMSFSSLLQLGFDEQEIKEIESAHQDEWKAIVYDVVSVKLSPEKIKEVVLILISYMTEKIAGLANAKFISLE